MALDTADLDPRLAKALVSLQAEAGARGIHPTLVSAFRTPEDQRQLYANFEAGRAGQPLPYPERGHVAMAAQPGHSLHEKGLAFDLSAGDRQGELDALAPSLGLRTIKGDPGHYELADGGSAPSAGRYSVDQIVHAIYGQESGYGKTAPSNPMQIQPGTWAIFAKPGEVITNPDDNRAVGRRMIQAFYDKYQGDPSRIAAAYFSGEGNVAPLADKLAYKQDKADASGKTVSSYVADINRRLGNPDSGGGGGGAQPTTDWASLLGAEPPPALSDLSSILGGAVGGGATASAPVGAGVEDGGDSRLPPVDLAYTPASPAPEEVGARYAQNKQARELVPLSNLFTLKTIGQPASKVAQNPYQSRIG